MKRARSSQLYQTAKSIIPGGVNSPARSWGAVGGDPIFFASGAGSQVLDVDCNKYIDYVCSWGALILGHADHEVVEAIVIAAQKGASFGAPTESENELALLIVNAFQSIEMLRFVSSGTEATMSALRLARAFTGRDKVVKFQGGYHGHSDALLVAAGSGAMAHGVPDSAGVTASFARDTLIAEYNDLASVSDYFDAFPSQIACVIVEPVAGNMGVVPPQPGYLEGLRKITARHDALLVFDEVISGFRVGYGGAQHLYGVIPDITCLGKIIGGGMPIGAYGGRREIMEIVSPLGPMYQAGTLSGNPVAMAAGLATLRKMRKPGGYERLEHLSSRLEKGLKQVFAGAKTPICINRVGSMMTVFFSDSEISGWSSVSRSGHQKFGRLFHRILGEGVYLPPSPFEAMFVSTAHTENDIDNTIMAAARALE